MCAKLFHFLRSISSLISMNVVVVCSWYAPYAIGWRCCLVASYLDFRFTGLPCVAKEAKYDARTTTHPLWLLSFSLSVLLFPSWPLFIIRSHSIFFSSFPLDSSLTRISAIFETCPVTAMQLDNFNSNLYWARLSLNLLQPL